MELPIFRPKLQKRIDKLYHSESTELSIFKTKLEKRIDELNYHWKW